MQIFPPNECPTRITDPAIRSSEVLLDQIGVVNGVPIGGRHRCLTEPGQIDQMNAMRMLEERRDAAQAFTGPAPSMQKDQVMGRRRSTDFVDQAGSAVLEALDGDESTSHDESGSVSRRYGVAECASRVSDGNRDSQPLVRQQHVHGDASARSVDRSALARTE